MSVRFLAWCWQIEMLFEKLCTKDLGSHPNATTDLAQILGVAERAAYVISQIEKRTAVDSRDVDYQMYGVCKAEIRYQPKDVIENIVRKSSFFGRSESCGFAKPLGRFGESWIGVCSLHL